MDHDRRDDEAPRSIAPGHGRGAVFVERATGRWVVLDPAGQFWVLPPIPEPWRARQPFHPGEDTDLDSVPGHYRHVLGLPF